MKKAIVLSGGGAKGAYEIGVWKALKKLHIKYDIVTGTSVGALNGALMTQKTFIKAYMLWQKIDFSLLFQKDELAQYQQNKNKKTLVKMYAKNILHGGMDVEGLENLVRKYLKPKKIKKSKIDFGIITVNSKTLKPKVIKKDEVNLTKLCDYLIASASCYPFFKKKDIETSKFIDGGFFDNMPINLAIEMGAEEIIAVDLKAIGINRIIKNKNIPITYIAPKNNIGNFLVFDKIQSKKAIKYGYNDTMKTFGKLEGDIFSFKRGQLLKNHNKNIAKFKNLINVFFTLHQGETLVVDLLEVASYKRLEKKKDKDFFATMNETLEYLGKIIDLDEYKIYSTSRFHKNIKKRMKDVVPASISNLRSRRIPHSKEITKYFYETFNLAKENKKLKKELCAFSIIFPKEFLAAIYLHMLEN